MEWITPHSGEESRSFYFDIPIPCNPAQLGQGTSLHGVLAPGDTRGTFATISFMLLKCRSLRQDRFFAYTSATCDAQGQINSKQMHEYRKLRNSILSGYLPGGVCEATGKNVIMITRIPQAPHFDSFRMPAWWDMRSDK